jgi:hypothetical protein
MISILRWSLAVLPILVATLIPTLGPGRPDSVVPDANFQVAAAALLQAGYLKVNVYEEQRISDSSYEFGYNFDFEEAEFTESNCLPPDDSEPGLSIRDVSLVISAIEQYNRGSKFRWAEFRVAELLLVLGVKPRLSLGIGQLKYEIAEEILLRRDPSITQKEVINRLEDTCESLVLIAEHVAQILQPVRDIGLRDQLTILSREYNGEREPITAINFRKALAAGYNIMGADYIWNTYEIDVSDSEPVVLYGDYDLPDGEGFDLIEFSDIAEGLAQFSARIQILLVAQVESNNFKQKGAALRKLRFIHDRLRILGVSNPMIKAYRYVEGPGRTGTVEIHLGSNAGLVEFVE